MLTWPIIVIGILLIVAVVLALIVWRLRQQVVRWKGLHDKVESEMKQFQSSQSQVIHTTKLASLGQMVAGLAHEVNTPLGFVKSNVEVVNELLDDYLKLVKAYDDAVQNFQQPVDMTLNSDPTSIVNFAKLLDARRKLQNARETLEKSTLITDAKDLMTDANEGIKQLSSLVLNLKGFARVDRDGLDVVDINEGVESSLMMAAHQLRGHVNVVKQLNPLPKVRCMPSQINQVFLNLITNAAQAMEKGGTLSIQTRPIKNAVEIEFTDTGSGISPEVLPKIFDPFFTTKSVGDGTGLGLSIVHKIIQSHGGDIKVNSTPGKGTVFTVRLPIEAPETAAAKSGKSANTNSGEFMEVLK